jgi:hypothetical protein
MTVAKEESTSPQRGGRMRGGPLDGRVMAYGVPLMPMYGDKNERVGSYHWIDDHWEYEPE